jgi:two-component system, LytTR family, response regulator
MINCLIVDDEPIARDIIAKYCNDLSAINVVASCDNALQAKAELSKHSIDLIFLDINMPVLDGLGFLKTLKHPPQIIFTTAYKEYAADAFDLSACDYLVKPFSFERFIVAIDKAIEKLKPNKETATNSQNTTADHSMFIRCDGKVFQVNYSAILFAEAKGNYTSVVTENNTLLTPMSFSAFVSLLPKSIFVRVHRSFIINTSRINHIEGNIVYIDKNEIPVGSNFKEDFFKFIKLQ